VDEHLLRSDALHPDERECSLYRFVGLDPHDRGIGDVLLYIGESAREPFTRMLEHIHEQSWAWRIRGFQVDKRVFASKEEVLAAEKHAIRTEQPIYNTEHNLGNPDRIATYGRRRRAPWVHRAGAGSWRPPRTPTTQRRRSWQWMRTPAALVVYAWLVLTAAGWWAADHYLQFAAGEDAVTGAVGAGVLLAGAAGMGAKRRHRRWWWLLCVVLGAGWLVVVADPTFTPTR
jgi:hypothetical protein